ncbi:MAG: hypothetical protein R6V12_07770, partial [Candidatus Hydrogenedentota bacterium]
MNQVAYVTVFVFRVLTLLNAAWVMSILEFRMVYLELRGYKFTGYTLEAIMQPTGMPVRGVFFLFLACAVSANVAEAGIEGTTVIEAFDSEDALAKVDAKGTACRLVDAPDGAGKALEATFEHAKRPGFALRGPDEGWDWSSVAGVAIHVTNPGNVPVNMEMTAFGKTGAGSPRTMEGKASIG